MGKKTNRYALKKSRWALCLYIHRLGGLVITLVDVDNDDRDL